MEDRLNQLYSVYLSFKDKEKISFKFIKRGIINPKRGCYIIFDKDGKSIYVGRSKSLRGRINQHRKSDSIASSFRRKIKKKYRFNTEEEVTNFIGENCSFIFIEIDDPKQEKNFEHFLIALLDTELND